MAARNMYLQVRELLFQRIIVFAKKLRPLRQLFKKYIGTFALSFAMGNSIECQQLYTPKVFKSSSK